MKFTTDTPRDLTRIEQAVVSFILGVLTTWLVIQDVGLADRWDAPAVILDIIILAASVGVWWGVWYGLLFVEKQ